MTSASIVAGRSTVKKVKTNGRKTLVKYATKGTYSEEKYSQTADAMKLVLEKTPNRFLY